MFWERHCARACCSRSRSRSRDRSVRSCRSPPSPGPARTRPRRAGRGGRRGTVASHSSGPAYSKLPPACASKRSSNASVTGHNRTPRPRSSGSASRRGRPTAGPCPRCASWPARPAATTRSRSSCGPPASWTRASWRRWWTSRRRVTPRQMERWARDFELLGGVRRVLHAPVRPHALRAREGPGLERPQGGVRQTGGVRADGRALAVHEQGRRRRVPRVPPAVRARSRRRAELREEGRELGAATDRRAQRRPARGRHRLGRAHRRAGLAQRALDRRRRPARAEERRRRQAPDG